MTTIIIVRHGYSCGNKEKKFSGQLNVPLDEVGYAQAREVCKYVMDNFKVDAVYSSDLCRAYDTVKPIAQKLQLPIHTCKELREVDVGKWQGMLIEDVERKFPESFNLYKKKPGIAQFDGGESYALLLNRVQPIFEKIAKENEGKTVVVGTHGGVIRVLRSVWEKVPMDRIEEIPHVPNASVTIALYGSDEIKLLQVGYNAFLVEKTTETAIK